REHYLSITCRVLQLRLRKLGRVPVADLLGLVHLDAGEKLRDLRERMPTVAIACRDQNACEIGVENSVRLAAEVTPHPLQVELRIVRDLRDRLVFKQLS